MPILTVCNDNSPLSQGDILTNVPVYLTGTNWSPDSPVAKESNVEALLILSRPCNCVNKDRITVAGIRGRKELTPKGVDTYDKAKEFLKQIRDGFDAPDRFYLGHIPTLPTARYYAHLDSLFTITLPEEPELRSKLVAKHRCARLTEDFRRDLHLRLFIAFADLGFDDIAWYSDADLSWLEAKAKERFSELDQAANAAAAKVAELIASGAVNQQQKSQADRENAAAKKARDLFMAELNDLTRELTNRSKTSG